MNKVIPVLCTLLVTALCTYGASQKTIDNLNAATRGEANASVKYEAFAKKAESEGYPQVARLFRAASKAEAIHRDAHKETVAKLDGKLQEVTFDKLNVGSTKENLADAIKGETYEKDVMYPGFIKISQEEQASPATRSFTYALKAETEHAQLYKTALANLGVSKEDSSIYVCPICGFTTTKPGEKCPTCGVAKARFLTF